MKPEGPALAETIYRVVDLLASKFRFGYYDVEDIRQEGCCFALEALASGKYDESRPLENFLYTHLRNRFINLKRDKYIRNEPPCLTCVFYDPKFKKSKNACSVFEDKNECKKLGDWRRRNAAKQSLMQPVDVAGVGDNAIKVENDTNETLSFNELKHRIDAQLPSELRSDYLRMLEGIILPKVRRQRVREAVAEILNAEEKNNSATG